VNNRGNALIVAMVAMTAISALAALSLSIVSSHAQSSRANVELSRAYFAAEAGIQHKIGQVRAYGLGDGAYEDVTGEVDGSLYAASLASWADDGVDNDGNGQVDDDVEINYYTFDSTGAHNGVRRRIVATVRITPPASPMALAAINIYNPLDENRDVYLGAMANFSGRVPPHIDGRDTNIPRGDPLDQIAAKDAQPGSGEGSPVLGIATHDEQSVIDINDAISRNRRRVMGLAGDAYTEEQLEDYFFSEDPPDAIVGEGSVGNVGKFDPSDANSIAAFALSCADHTRPENFFDATNYPSGNATMGTLDTPQITYIKNETSKPIILNGTITGCGILVIQGKVVFRGTLTYAGIIFAITDDNSPATQTSVVLDGTPLIFGSIFAASTKLPGPNAPAILDFRGTADLFYSNEALGLAMMILPTDVRVLASNETGLN